MRAALLLLLLTACNRERYVAVQVDPDCKVYQAVVGVPCLGTATFQNAGIPMCVCATKRVVVPKGAVLQSVRADPSCKEYPVVSGQPCKGTAYYNREHGREMCLCVDKLVMVPQ